MVTIKKQLVPERAIRTKTFGRLNKKKFITIHETGNTNRGADAQAHANIQSRINPRDASWQYQVDDKEIIQSYDHDVSCWAGGDGRGDGNMNSIHIEICVNSDGDYLKAVDNAAALTRYLMREENIPVEDVVQHHHWSGKNCPQNLRAGSKGIDWKGFVSKLTVVEQVSKPVAPKPVKPAQKPVGNTESIVDYLNARKQDSGFSARAKLAAAYNIPNYRGTAAQNVQLLELLRNDKPSVPAPKPTKEYVQLPKSAPTWRTYRLNVQPVAENSDWSLTPSKFGGLEYEVIGRPLPNVVTINTSRGKRNIYAAPSTGAKLIKK